MANTEAIREGVKDYYGKQLQATSDLKTSACCTSKAPPKRIRDLLALVHPEILVKFYGCGLVCPPCLEGITVLDLGCGAGRDCYVLSALVGQQGKVIGVDMTDEQLAVATKYVDYHAKKFNLSTSNVEFKKGYIENLREVGIADGSVDLVVSNCVVNLSTDKDAVLRECFRVLKPGGEMYFSDVYADRRVPSELLKDPVLYGECLSGALYWNDFKSLVRKVGFCDALEVESAPIAVDRADLRAKLGATQFFSVTYRLLKAPDQEPSCEDYGQSVTYNGGVADAEEAFRLDQKHAFPKGQTVRVCGNTFSQLQSSRYASYFTFVGDRKTHLGLFDCASPFQTSEASSASCSTSKGCC